MLFDKGLRFDSINLRILSTPGHGGIGIATTRKIGCHVRRNRCKRKVTAVLREAITHGAFEQKGNAEAIKSAYTLDQKDWAIVVKKDLCTVPYNLLVQEVMMGFFKSAEKWEETPH